MVFISWIKIKKDKTLTIKSKKHKDIEFIQIEIFVTVCVKKLFLYFFN